MEAAITALIDEYKAALDKKDELEAEEKANNAWIIELRDKLAAAMVEAEVPAIERGGYTYRLKPTTKYTKRKGADEQLFEMLRDNGLGDLIKETVNAQTLQGVMSNIAEKNDETLPKEWLEVINVYEYNDVSKRKAALKKKAF